MDEDQIRMIAMYLSGLGGAIGGGEPVAPALDKITGQQIGAKSQANLQQKYIEILKQILGGLPEGADLKGNRDKMTLNIPVSGLGGISGPVGGQGVQMPGGGRAASNLPGGTQRSDYSLMNPFWDQYRGGD